GAGGRGGILRSTLNLSAYAELTGGSAGKKGSDHVGGVLSTRAFVWRTYNTVLFNGRLQTSFSDQTAPKVAGANAAAPTATNGLNGSVVVTTNVSAWVHSFGLRNI